jgi:peptidoglycan glycosyltransferase
VKQSELAARTRELAFAALIAFCAMPFFIGYWAVFRSHDLKVHPANRRAEARLARVKPGRVLTADGAEVLGRQRAEGRGPWERTYPSPRTYCHLTGYDRQTGLQLSLRESLLEPASNRDLVALLENPEPVGCDVELTLNGRAQATARDLLDGSCGAVVALNPRTGAVLVLASTPTFDPQGIRASRESLELFRTDPDSPALNRAVQGLYPPGSIFKIITTAAALESGAVSADVRRECTGSVRVGDREFHCWKAGGHGSLDLADALAQSCNVYYAQLGRDLGGVALAAYATQTGLFGRPALELPPATMLASRLDPGGTDDLSAASYAVGQDRLLITPFAAAQMAGAVANGGLLMQPHLVQAVLTPQGAVRRHAEARATARALRESTASLLAGMMEAAVECGTGTAAQIEGVRVAGKTGSAQAPGGQAHAWFVGFAPVQDPTVAIAVVIERGGTGGGAAAPIARELMAVLLSAGS